MQNRLRMTCTIFAFIAIAYCRPADAQQAQSAPGEKGAQPQMNTEPATQPRMQPSTEPASQPQPSTAPVAQTDAVPAPQPPPAPPAPPAQPTCDPNCRAGYTCRYGQCVSSCNPPCESYETCSQSGVCVSKQVPSQYPVYEAEETKPRYQHVGFFLRFTYGLGWSNAKASYEIENSGISQFLGFDIGGAVTENLILHARLSGLINHVDERETIELNDEPVELKVPAIGNILLGGGLTYYIMPANLYTTFVLGIAGTGLAYETRRLTDEEEDLVEDYLEQPEAGVGFNFDFGKEWWVGSEWGLGIAGRFSYSSVSPEEDAESDDWLSCIGLGVLFTATLN